MAVSGEVTHLFAELSSLDELGSLLGKSTRLKYTCLSVSKKYLALGSNSGGVYIFNRDTLKYLQVVFGGTEASLVVSVSLSPSDQHVAIALSTGHVAVYELNIDRRSKPDRVRYTQEHLGHTVTAFTWDDVSSRLFAGDNAGNISIISVPSNKSKNLFNFPSELIAHVDTAVYQMAWWKDKLLVSTITHTHLFDTLKKNFCTIGTKSRDGEYGSCFYIEPSSKYTVIYCARPGSRMWEVDFEGKVLNTHQLKQLLSVPPVPVINLGNEHFELGTASQSGQSISFYKLFHISQFIITWSSKGVCLFDPVNVKVMIWTQSFKGIKDMSVYNNDVYLYLENSSVHRLTLLPIYQLFTVLSSRGLWSLSSSLLLAADQVGIRQAVVKKIKKDLLQNILAGLKSEGRHETAEKVKASMEDVSEGSIDSMEVDNDFMDSAEVKGHTYLPSGMVIVNDGIQVKRLWERKTVVDFAESAAPLESGSSHRQKYLGEKDSELPNKAHYANSYESNKSVGERTNESNIYEQMKDFGLVNKNNEEGQNEASSSILNTFDNDGVDSGHVFNSEVNVNSHNHASDNSANTDDEVKNNVLTTFSYLTQENGLCSTSQESDHEKKCSVSDVAVAHYRQIKDNTHPSSCSDTVVADDIPAADTGASLSLQPSLDNGCTTPALSLANEIFHSAETASSDTGIIDTNPSATASSDKGIIDTNPSATTAGCDKGIIDTNPSATAAGCDKGIIDTNPSATTAGSDKGIIDTNPSATAAGCDKGIIDTNPSATAPFCDYSEEVELTVTKNKMFTVGSDDDSATSEDRSSSPPLDIAACETRSDPADSGYCFSDKNSTDFSQTQDAAEEDGEECVSYSDYMRLEARLQSDCSEVDMAASGGDTEIFLGNSTQKSAESDDTISAMAALSSEELMGFSSSRPSIHSPLKFLQTGNTDIAKPVKVSKKKRKMLNGVNRSVSVDVESTRTNKAKTLRKMASLGDEQAEPQFLQGMELEMDSISIATVSSLEEEDHLDSPDSLSAAGDLEVREQTTVQVVSSELSLMPPDEGKPLSRTPTLSSISEERKPEVIPPLIDRLAAARGPVNDEVSLGVHQDSPFGSPQPGDHFPPVGSSRTSLSALKDGLSLKLKTQTKSLIKTFKEKNPLMTKSSSTPMFPSASSQQFDQYPKDATSPQAQSTVEVNTRNDLNKAKNLAVMAANLTELYNTACNIQQQLRTSAVINPALLGKILNQWATELNLAVSRYHEQLLKRTNEMQLKQHELQSSLPRNNHSPEEIDTDIRNHEQKIGRGFHPGSSNGASLELPSPSFSQDTQNILGSPSSVIISPVTEAADLNSTEPNTPMHKDLSPTYWANQMHSDDPFHLPQKHLDLFRTLTTMCFVCGETGDILSHLGFTEETHYRTFVQLVLPTSLSSLFNPGCECFMSFSPDSLSSSTKLSHNRFMSFSPDSHSSSTKPSQNQISSNNLRTEFGDKTGPSQTSNTPVVNAAPNNSESHTKGDVVDMIQENDRHPTVFNDAHEVGSQHNSEHEQVSTVCSCGHSLRTWSESEQFRRDTSLALFTRLFFFALDYEQVKQALDKHNKMFITWASLVLSSKGAGNGDIVSSILTEKQTNSAIDYLRSGILPRRSALLGHVYRLFELAPVKTSEFCGEIWKSISPVDLVQLCSLCSKPASPYLLRYFKQAMIHTSTVKKPDALRRLCQHRDVRYLLLDALLPSQSADVFFDGSKSLAALLKAVLPINWLNILLSMIASEEERDKVVQLSAKKDCLEVCVKLLAAVDQWQKLLQLIVDFNNIRLLKGKHGEDGFVPRNEQEWKFLLTCFHTKWSAQNHSALASEEEVHGVEGVDHKAQTSHEQHYGLLASSSSLGMRGNTSDTRSNTTTYNVEEDAAFLSRVMTARKLEDSRVRYESFPSGSDQDDCSPDNSITWHSLGSLLLEHIGGAAAMELLEEHLSDPTVVRNCLRAEFLKACYLDFCIKMEQSHVMHDILERLSVHMWKKRPDFVPTSVFQSISAEKKLRENGEWEDVSVQEMFNQVKALESREIMSKHLGSQWGQEINICSICQCCHISLKSVMTLTVQGVIVFPCGHAFHKTCVSGTSCPVIH